MDLTSLIMIFLLSHELLLNLKNKSDFLNFKVTFILQSCLNEILIVKGLDEFSKKDVDLGLSESQNPYIQLCVEIVVL